MIFNDKPNCQVSRILMNPRPIFVKRSENDSPTTLSVVHFITLNVINFICEFIILLINHKKNYKVQLVFFL
jgi:hypothetical protein